VNRTQNAEYKLCPLSSENVIPSEVFALLKRAMGRPENAKATWQKYLQSPDTQLWGLFKADSLQALAGIQVKQQSAQLMHLAVAPGLERQGKGRLILKSLITQKRLWRLDAETDAEALGFYQKMGWATLPLGQGRFGCYWLDRDQVLAPHFTWPEIPLETFNHLELEQRDLQLQILRADQLHPLLSGNKWFKLQRTLRQAHQRGQKKLLSFGGAWSNHLFSLAAAGKLLGFDTIGLLRGEEPPNPSPILNALREWGMKIHWLDRGIYRKRNAPPFLQELQKKFPDTWIIPEGGSGIAGVQGAQDIARALPSDTDLLVSAVGTGTTLAGLISAAPLTCQILGVAVVKGADYLLPEIQTWLESNNPDLPLAAWELETRFHAGGYAKSNAELRSFIEGFSSPQLPLEPVYTGKAFWGLWQRILNGELAPQTQKICFLHTGGVYPWNSQI
jgi:1-aminocyclopropane-1-carboxylate deaminase